MTRFYLFGVVEFLIQFTFRVARVLISKFQSERKFFSHRMARTYHVCQFHIGSLFTFFMAFRGRKKCNKMISLFEVSFSSSSRNIHLQTHTGKISSQTCCESK
jgi:hypothetical protein